MERGDYIVFFSFLFLVVRFSVASIADHNISGVWGIVVTVAAATSAASQTFTIARKPRGEEGPSLRSHGFGYASGSSGDSRNSVVNDSFSRRWCPRRRRVGGCNGRIRARQDLRAG